VAQPYVGEIRMFAGNFAPAGWMFCDGQLLPISEYDTLFVVIGTTYGGDGQSTFALPDLQSRVPIHQGGGFTLGEHAGVESVTLTTGQMPVHSHPLRGTTSIANSTGPGGNVLAQSSVAKMYFADVVDTEMAHTIQSAGGSQPHDNLQPYLVINFIISLFGIFPSPT
jgi:microcystin-dependent protein